MSSGFSGITTYEIDIGDYKSVISRRNLITLIEGYPMLWDREHPKYFDKNNKENVWRAICKELNPDWDSLPEAAKMVFVKTVIRKWYCTREAYLKYIRLVQQNKQSKPYIFADLLKFLDPHLQLLSKMKKNEEANTEKHQIFIQEESNIEHEETIENPGVSETWYKMIEEEPPAKKVKTENDGVNNNNNLVKMFKNVLYRETDEDKAFFNSLIPHVRSLSNDSKLNFRIDVLKILQKYVKIDKEENFMHIERLEESDNE